MTYEEALEELPNIENFCNRICNTCTANDWYCPTYCLDLEKAHRIPFDKIAKSYARNDGDVWRVMRYIRRYKEKTDG
jgi:hypothetical protein